MAKIELAMCPVMCFLSTAHDGVLTTWMLDRQMVPDLGVQVPLSSALRQLIAEIGFLKLVEASRFNPVLSYVVFPK